MTEIASPFKSLPKRKRNNNVLLNLDDACLKNEVLFGSEENL